MLLDIFKHQACGPYVHMSLPDMTVMTHIVVVLWLSQCLAMVHSHPDYLFKSYMNGWMNE